MQNRINLLDLANKNSKMDLEVLRKAAETSKELKKFGVDFDSHFRIDGPFDSLQNVFLQSTKK